MSLWLTIIGSILVSLLFRAIWVFRSPPPERRVARRVLVVLGSGGHTGEMLMVLRNLPKAEWSPKRVKYVVSETDKDSAGAAERFEMAHIGRRAEIAVIPRAREVGQSYFTSIFTTLRALFASLMIVFDETPDVILTNGPGVCVPIVAANFLVALLFQGRRRAIVAYFESFTCVSHLSLSGKILLPLFADLFTVQWPALYERLAKKHATVKYTGPFALDAATAAATSPLLLPPPGTLGTGKARRTLVVTVGSTCFDELIAAIDTHAFMDAAIAAGINHILVQKGRSTVHMTYVVPPTLLQLEVVEYRAHLAETMRDACLVISHAGAGTILECLGAGVPLIVVPNQRLMSNHQLELAHALAFRKVLVCATPQELASTLLEQPWRGLVRFPPVNTSALKKHVGLFMS